MKTKFLLLSALLALASCTAPTTPTPPTNTTNTGTPTVNTTSSGTATQAVTPTTPVTPIVSSGTQTIPTPTYGTGKLIVEIFADFQCPACIQFSQVVQPIFEEYAQAGKLQIVFRQYPLTSIHKNAMGDALAALCAAEQGKYMDYKKWLYALEGNKAGALVTNDDRINLAKTNGLDVTKFTSCLTTEAYKWQVEADVARGDSLGVTGTPTTYVGGVKLDMSVFAQSGIPGFKSWLESQMK